MCWNIVLCQEIVTWFWFMCNNTCKTLSETPPPKKKYDYSEDDLPVPWVVLLRQPDVRMERIALRGSANEGRGGEALPVGAVQALLGLVQAERGGPHAHPVRVRVVLHHLWSVHPLHGPTRIFDGEGVRFLRGWCRIWREVQLRSFSKDTIMWKSFFVDADIC